jgi:hypothetical protein
MARNETMLKVRQFIRQPVAWPGGYPVILLMGDGECLCADCAKENYRLISQATRAGDRQSGWNAADTDIYWEGAPLYCAHCNKQTESAYGEPDSE